MKLAPILLFFAAATLVSAQTTAPTSSGPTKSAATSPAARKPLGAKPACAKLPDLSPAIPALPPGLPCARPLYTLTILPTAKLDYVSPLENTQALRTTLGIESSSFSLDYVDIIIGAGALAAPHKWYTIHYSGYLVNGLKFDSSYDHPDREPISIAYGQHGVIPGWDTGFDGMRIGGKRRLFIPSQLAYGPNGKSPIPPNSELIFDVELVSQSDTKPAAKPLQAPPPTPAAPTPPAPAAPATPATPPSAPATPTAPPSAPAPASPPSPTAPPKR